jgi:hypothetical protein
MSATWIAIFFLDQYPGIPSTKTTYPPLPRLISKRAGIPGFEVRRSKPGLSEHRSVPCLF